MIATPERKAELIQSLASVQSRIVASTTKAALHGTTLPMLVAVSKLKPASDVLACYEGGQRDFGENYAQELVEKAGQLPDDIRWHFIGTLQSNKAKMLAEVRNLHTIQTLTSIKVATALENALHATRTIPVHVLIQVNTSGESSKSGLPHLSPGDEGNDASAIFRLSKHIITACPRLRLQGVMTIGAWADSHHAENEENQDFKRIKQTRDVLQTLLELDGAAKEKWGENGQLLMSMGMSSDFEEALECGSDYILMLSLVRNGARLYVRSSLARIPLLVAGRRYIQTEVIPPSTSTEILNKQRLQRPSSPHFTIYQPQLTWLGSIAHRVTGTGLSALLYGYCLAYLVAPGTFDSASAVEFVSGLPEAIKYAGKAILAVPFTFHSFNGLRHLAWDSGKFLTVKGAYASGYAVLGATALSTIWLLTL